MAGAADQDDRWKLLGRMLERRRYELDPRYDNLTVFCDERGVDYRLCWDIENDRRHNFKRGTLAELARAYMLETWSIEEFVYDGKPLVPLDHNPYADDRVLAEVWNRSQGLDPEQRHGLVALTRRARGERGNGGRGRGETRKRA